LSKVIHYDGKSAAHALAAGLVGLPLAPRLGVYVWSCNCGADLSPKGFSSELAANFSEALSVSGIAREITTVLAHISLSDQQPIEKPIAEFTHIKVDQAYSRLDSELLQLVRSRVGAKAASQVSANLPKILTALAATAAVTAGIFSEHIGVLITGLALVTPVAMGSHASAKNSRQTLRVFEIKDDGIKATVEHGVTALPRALGTACKAAL
jgi:hypothetical protein